MNIHVVDLQKKIATPTNYVIDIGASYGVSSDPVYPFIVDSTFRGLCIEGLSDRIPRLRENIAPTFDVHNEFVNPGNICDIFEKYNVPVELDVLKVDIDGYDLDLLRAILKKYRPKIIISEINEKIPPPVCFEIPYRDNYAWDNSHCFGFSLSAGKKVMDEHQYKILSVYELNNMLCCNVELCDTLGLDRATDEMGVYRKGYKSKLSERIEHLPWNAGVERWLHINDKHKLIDEIRHYFTQVNDRSQFAVKTKVEGTEFLLSLA